MYYSVGILCVAETLRYNIAAGWGEHPHRASEPLLAMLLLRAFFMRDGVPRLKRHPQRLRKGRNHQRLGQEPTEPGPGAPFPRLLVRVRC